MTGAANDPTIRFPCGCGATLSARASQAGRKGKCKSCGQVLVIPDAASLSPSAKPAGKVFAVQEVCSVCQTGIEEDDERWTCNRCDLPFHTECWRENLGCSAYGCENVNVLKQGPDMRLGPFQGVPPTMPAPYANPYANPISNPYASPMARPLQPAARRPEDDIPWEYVLLAGSALAALVSIVTCGVPSLATGVVALVMGIARGERIGWTIPAIAIVISVLGMICGLCLSAALWGGG